jgi:predicted house-cleaning noncanonical NTP pyrophosphatase (MazG superfamily)
MVARGRYDAERKSARGKARLVRDKIPQIMRLEGKQPVIRNATGAELVDALREKLVEEALEAREAESREELVEELIDVSEVMRAIRRALLISRGEFGALRDRKAKARGRFSKGFVLEGSE